MGVEIVVESTGRFTEGEKAKAHLTAGAKKVIISAPAKERGYHYRYGYCEKKIQRCEHHIIQMLPALLTAWLRLPSLENFGIENGLMTTVHSYTNDQENP